MHNLIEPLAIVIKFAPHKDPKLLLVDSELRPDLNQCLFEVLHGHFDVLSDDNLFGKVHDVVVARHCEGGRALDQGLDFGTSVVFGESGQLWEVDVAVEQAVIPEVLGVDSEDLLAAVLTGKAHFDVHLEPAWPKNGLINQIFSVGHANDQDIVQGLNTVDIGKQLVDN